MVCACSGQMPYAIVAVGNQDPRENDRGGDSIDA
jgi:hypothetical protein